MLALGIHFGSHDTSAALVEDGRIIAVMEQERFDHCKHTRAFPIDAVHYCLAEGGIRLHGLDYVACATDPALTNAYKQRFIDDQTSTELVPRMYGRQDVEATVRRELGGDVPFFLVDHHKAHAASAFFLSPYEEAAVLTIDGMGNWVTTTTNLGRRNTIETLRAIPHPHSLGLFYGAVTQFLGFRAACDECKTMGLASFGAPTYLDDLRRMCTYENGMLSLDLRYFTFHNQPLMNGNGEMNTWYSAAFAEHFGPPRVPESEITDRERDLARSIQMLLEERTFALLRDLHQRTGCANLCLAGGVALNSTLNGRITANTPFTDVFIVPAANDAGISLGAALCCTAERSPDFKRHHLDHCYFGSAHSTEEIEAELSQLPPNIRVDQPADLVGQTADLLVESQIVGWYQGRMEFGPRALGNRSILANPTNPSTKDIVNQKVKFRENFRPFAPIVPLEHVGEYFEADDPLPYMLKVVQVREEKRADIPAVTHVDYSARVQTVTHAQNAPLHDLLHAVQKRNGVPVLLNTSFNIRGDTIVRTPQDAIDCFLKTGMNALAIGPYLLTKTDDRAS